MTPTVEQLREWSVKLMGWHTHKLSAFVWIDPTNKNTIVKANWTPDNSKTGQIWMVVERMRELGYLGRMVLTYEKGAYLAYYWDRWDIAEAMPPVGAANPALAILLAAYATGEGWETK